MVVDVNADGTPDTQPCIAGARDTSLMRDLSECYLKEQIQWTQEIFFKLLKSI